MNLVPGRSEAVPVRLCRGEADRDNGGEHLRTRHRHSPAWAARAKQGAQRTDAGDIH